MTPVGLGREEGAQQEIDREGAPCDNVRLDAHGQPFLVHVHGSSINDFHNVQRLRDIGFEPLVLQGVHNMAPGALSLLKEEMAN